MKISLAFSPCPNDTYIFDALVHGLIDTEGLEFEYRMADVEQLNQAAFAEIPDVTKLSFYAFLSLAGTYRLLDAGAALGFGTGPLLIGKNPIQVGSLAGKRIAIPGEHTTANLLFSIAFPAQVQKVMLLFSEIEDAIISGVTDAGVIIHENRFTYKAKGLYQIMDLGQYWENLTHMPVPLGGIVAHSRLDTQTMAKVERSIRRSIEHANANHGKLSQFIRCHAAEMDESVMQQHIALYVNEFSVSLGAIGRKAVMKLFELAQAEGLIKQVPENIFA